MEIAASANGVPALKVRGYWRTVGYRLRYDYVTLFFALVIICIALSAICAPLLAPFDPLKTSMDTAFLIERLEANAAVRAAAE